MPDVGYRKRTFSRKDKEKIILDLIHERISLNELASKYKIDKYLILRWRDRYLVDQGESSELHSKEKLKSHGATINFSSDSTTDYALKIKLAELMLENEKLKAENAELKAKRSTR